MNNVKLLRYARMDTPIIMKCFCYMLSEVFRELTTSPLYVSFYENKRSCQYLSHVSLFIESNVAISELFLVTEFLCIGAFDVLEQNILYPINWSAYKRCSQELLLF